MKRTGKQCIYIRPYAQLLNFPPYKKPNTVILCLPKYDAMKGSKDPCSLRKEPKVSIGY
jgi:hypothetical protein